MSDSDAPRIGGRTREEWEALFHRSQMYSPATEWESDTSALLDAAFSTGAISPEPVSESAGQEEQLETHADAAEARAVQANTDYENEQEKRAAAERSLAEAREKP